MPSASGGWAGSERRGRGPPAFLSRAVPLEGRVRMAAWGRRGRLCGLLGIRGVRMAGAAVPGASGGWADSGRRGRGPPVFLSRVDAIEGRSGGCLGAASAAVWAGGVRGVRMAGAVVPGVAGGWAGSGSRGREPPISLPRAVASRGARVAAWGRRRRLWGLLGASGRERGPGRSCRVWPVAGLAREVGDAGRQSRCPAPWRWLRGGGVGGCGGCWGLRGVSVGPGGRAGCGRWLGRLGRAAARAARPCPAPCPRAPRSAVAVAYRSRTCARRRPRTRVSGCPVGDGAPLGCQMPAAADRSRLTAASSSVARARAAGRSAWAATGTTTSR
ncbi:hypothetical protein EDD94_0796 [Streptomyces sp. PanSC9]|nr:hypothetical protein EDD94_0796 [Streptomyces sp. PanSC9]